eukprot:6315798-Prorocentrum_lima.AAC.1
MQHLSPRLDLPVEWQDCDNRISIMLMRALPQKMKSGVFEEAGWGRWVGLSTMCIVRDVG